MALVQPIAFSPNGEYFAHSSPDGTFKLWETSTSTLKQEYTPSSHLSATCSCLSWAPLQHSSVSPRKKKKRRKSGGGESSSSCDLVALGTTSGSILIYSLVKGDLQTQLSGGHSDTVHCTCWHPDGSTLYSCSADQYIVEWCLTTGTIKHKWKADRGSVYSLALCGSERHLLSAGRTIKLWDLETRELLKTFPGHATEVFKVLPVPSHTAASTEDAYFLSAALNDRLVHAWRIGSMRTTKEKSSLASFALVEEPCHVQIRQAAHDQPIYLGVVTKSGQLFIFQHVLNGPSKKPLKPMGSIQIATGGGQEETPKPIAILASYLCSDTENNVLFVHGNFMRLTFEKLSCLKLEESGVLVRDYAFQSVISTEVAVSKVRTPGVSKDVTILAPSHMAPTKPRGAESVEKQSKKKRRKSTEMTLDDRLNAISLDKTAVEKPGTQPPQADTLATLLSQGLQSNDKKILNSVLQHTGDSIIRNTVKRLPVPVILPLVQELSKRMHGHAQSGTTLVKWIKMVLTIHTSYLMTFPDLVDTFSSMYQMMDSRVAIFSRLSKLQGKLDLMLSQITSQTVEDEDTVSGQQPMLLYQDDWSDEDIGAGDIVPDQSESEDNWEELSSEEEEMTVDQHSDSSSGSGSDDSAEKQNGEEDMSD